MDYLPGLELHELVGDVLAEAHKPKVKKPDVPLSKKQIDLHYDDLYLGYVKKLNEIERKLKKTDHKKANATYSEFRELKREASFAMNAVRLHEAYFSGLQKSKRPNLVDQQLTASFEKTSKWEDDFFACGMSARGWVVLGYDCENDRLVNVISDMHDIGGVWGIYPLLILDMYEHAFMIDFGANKGKYLEFFMSNINWDYVAGRLSEVE